MLIEFSVENYRSFRERQTFSMVAAPRLSKKENVLKPLIEGEKIPDLLKVATIYGPNASGKSNLIKAMGIVQTMVNRPPAASSSSLPFPSFRFDKELASKPSRFEVHFIANHQRYEFILAATPERIIEEQLTIFPKGKETLLYSRKYTQDGEKYIFGDALEGERALHNVWRKLTNTKTLFISQAVANSNEELQQLRKPFEWFFANLQPVDRNMENFAKLLLSVVNAHPELGIGGAVATFLREMDVPITSIRCEQQNVDRNHSDTLDSDKEASLTDYLNMLFSSFKIPSNEQSSKAMIDYLHNMFSAVGNIKTTLTHETALGEAEFDFDEESDGTKNLFGFSFPWWLMSSTPITIAMDELDSSLHPKIVANLIKKLLNSNVGSQLIFTTHDTHLMDSKLLRRDQFWITERDANGATQLRSIHDFEGREGEDIEKRYFEGRYRGLPIL